MTIEQIEISTLRFEDYQELLEAMKASYVGWQGGYWSPGAIERLIEKFPEGQIVVKADGVVVGCALSIIVDYKRFGDNHTYKQITGNYTFN
ncbi:MAG: carbon-nitrogen hydrolase, partial [Chitinophagaceae bacterium]|nr:carbon-nitrogen hydrolase [Chitinophagaceae bacterium]